MTEQPTIEQQRSCVQALWELWDRHAAAVPADGTRLFIRWAVWRDDPGWDDWALVGLLQPDRTIQWLKDDAAEMLMGKELAKSVAAGGRTGKIRVDGGGCEWGLFHGDGPLEPRVSDWAGLK